MSDHQDAGLWPELPIEFFVIGIPVSMQGSTRSKNDWQQRVRAAAMSAVPPGSWAITEVRLSVSIIYFPMEPLKATSTIASNVTLRCEPR